MTGYDSEDEVTQKLRSGGEGRPGHGDHAAEPPAARGREAAAAAEPGPAPQLHERRARAGRTRTTTRAPSTRPYIVYKTGIAYRTDFVEPSVVEEKGWDILWDPAYKGYVGLLDDSRETISSRSSTPVRPTSTRVTRRSSTRP